MFTLVLATNNAHKTQEIREILMPYGINLLSIKEAGLVQPPVEENGKTYKENAIIKANSLKELTSYAIIADDSGLEIKSMNNEPGIRSARFADSFGGHANAINYILKQIENKDRSAQFVCDIALVNVEENPVIFEAIVKGHITEEVDGEGGFGYDPVFYNEELHKTYARMSEEEKNKVSHRGKALSLLIKYLKDKGLI